MKNAVENPVSDEAELTIAVLAAGRWVVEIGGVPALKSKVMTIVSELGRNILKYAGRGRIHCELIDHRARRGIQIVVEDRGPGIGDLEAAMSDHFSTGGTLGLGLPGVRRMVDDFDLQSKLGEGTTVRVRIWIDRN